MIEKELEPETFTCVACKASVSVENGCGDCLSGCCDECYTHFHSRPKGMEGLVLERALEDHDRKRCEWAGVV